MPRKLPEEFEGKELMPLCIAPNLAEANKIESILDEENIDYTFEIARFTGGLRIEVTEGVLFLFYSGQENYCKDLFKRAGLSYLLVS